MSISQVAARRVCFTTGISASSMYFSTLNIQAMMMAIDISFTSNLSGFGILIESSIFGDSFDSNNVSILGDVSFSDCVSDSISLWDDSLVCL